MQASRREVKEVKSSAAHIDSKAVSPSSHSATNGKSSTIQRLKEAARQTEAIPKETLDALHAMVNVEKEALTIQLIENLQQLLRTAERSPIVQIDPQQITAEDNIEYLNSKVTFLNQTLTLIKPFLEYASDILRWAYYDTVPHRVAHIYPRDQKEVYAYSSTPEHHRQGCVTPKIWREAQTKYFFHPLHKEKRYHVIRIDQFDEQQTASSQFASSTQLDESGYYQCLIFTNKGLYYTPHGKLQRAKAVLKTTFDLGLLESKQALPDEKQAIELSQKYDGIPVLIKTRHSSTGQVAYHLYGEVDGIWQLTALTSNIAALNLPFGGDERLTWQQISLLPESKAICERLERGHNQPKISREKIATLRNEFLHIGKSLDSDGNHENFHLDDSGHLAGFLHEAGLVDITPPIAPTFASFMRASSLKEKARDSQAIGFILIQEEADQEVKVHADTVLSKRVNNDVFTNLRAAFMTLKNQHAAEDEKQQLQRFDQVLHDSAVTLTDPALLHETKIHGEPITEERRLQKAAKRVETQKQYLAVFVSPHVIAHCTDLDIFREQVVSTLVETFLANDKRTLADFSALVERLEEMRNTTEAELIAAREAAAKLASAAPETAPIAEEPGLHKIQLHRLRYRLEEPLLLNALQHFLTAFSQDHEVEVLMLRVKCVEILLACGDSLTLPTWKNGQQSDSVLMIFNQRVEAENLLSRRLLLMELWKILQRELSTCLIRLHSPFLVEVRDELLNYIAERLDPSFWEKFDWRAENATGASRYRTISYFMLVMEYAYRVGDAEPVLKAIQDIAIARTCPYVKEEQGAFDVQLICLKGDAPYALTDLPMLALKGGNRPILCRREDKESKENVGGFTYAIFGCQNGIWDLTPITSVKEAQPFAALPFNPKKVVQLSKDSSVLTAAVIASLRLGHTHFHPTWPELRTGSSRLYQGLRDYHKEHLSTPQAISQKVVKPSTPNAWRSRSASHGFSSAPSSQISESKNSSTSSVSNNVESADNNAENAARLKAAEEKAERSDREKEQHKHRADELSRLLIEQQRVAEKLGEDDVMPDERRRLRTRLAEIKERMAILNLLNEQPMEAKEASSVATNPSALFTVSITAATVTASVTSTAQSTANSSSSSTSSSSSSATAPAPYS